MQPSANLDVCTVLQNLQLCGTLEMVHCGSTHSAKQDFFKSLKIFFLKQRSKLEICNTHQWVKKVFDKWQKKIEKLPTIFIRCFWKRNL